VTDALTSSSPAPGVRLLTLSRPERLNALSRALIEDLHGALDDLEADRTCRVVVLTGAGRAFCAGLDLVDSGIGGGERSPQQRMATQQRIASLVLRLRGLHAPVVAAVNGPAAGGGMALALASDLRVASESASFHLAFLRLGLSGCDIGVSWLLPRLVGASLAFEILLTGRPVEAAEALRVGLVSDVVPDADLPDRALALAAAITANSPMGVRMTKEVMWAQLEIPGLRAGIDLENRTQVVTTFSEDHREAVAAFQQRRPADFHDR
jgi:enoyl-CoA hydratase